MNGEGRKLDFIGKKGWIIVNGRIKKGEGKSGHIRRKEERR